MANQSNNKNKDSYPLITIAIPTFNRFQLLKSAIDSALNQTYPNIEVLVCDNASTDLTEFMVGQCTDPRLRYVRHTENVGIVEN
jgi:glycosyltransferase involved in cell wall biosynthesis